MVLRIEAAAKVGAEVIEGASETSPTRRVRRSQVVWFLILLVFAWLAMTVSHELGHIVAGVCCGGTLESYSLSPVTLPYSIFNLDPYLLITLGCGPLLEVSMSFVLALTFRKRAFWFIAYFCGLANGLYLAVAWVSGDRYLDTPKLLEHGAWPASVLAFCVVTIIVGYVGFRHECQVHLATSQRG